jgi:hypothetical protein
MGLWVWLSSFFHRKRVHCDVCMTEIRASEFVKGRALVIARKKFCHGCVDWVMQGNQREEWKLRGLLRPNPLEMSSSTSALLG